MRDSSAVLCAILGLAAASLLHAQEATLPAGTALRVELDSHVRIRPGAKITGHLTEPIYLVDHEVVPVGAEVTGIILGTRPGPRAERVQRLLAADFTPPRIPDAIFQTLTLATEGTGGRRVVAINAPAEITMASVLTLGVQRKKQSIKEQIGGAIDKETHDVKDTFHHHHFDETVEKWSLGQLPYHPDILWTGTRFNADLATPVQVPDSAHRNLRLQDLEGALPQGTLHARLTIPVSSQAAKRGDPVEAIVTQPLFSPDGTSLLVPEGTALHGVIVHAKAARSFGRNGDARFAFRRLDLPTATGPADPMEIHGRLSAAETSPDQHVKLDEEGEVRADNGPTKYTEPLLLGILAITAGPDDGHPSSNNDFGSSTVASNGFGLIARVLSLSTRNYSVTQSFAYYALAKSVYFRFVAKGHETAFARDTEIQVTLSER